MWGLLLLAASAAGGLLRGGSGDVLTALFATFQRSQPRLRPDGEEVGYLVPSNSGALNVAVAKASTPLDRRKVTHYREHVQSWSFLGSERIVCLHDAEGREEFALDVVDLASHETRRLADRVEGFWVSAEHPDSVLVAYPAGSADVWRVDVQDPSQRTRVAKNPGNATGYTIDEAKFEVVAAVVTSAEREQRTLLRLECSECGTWLPVLSADLDDELALVAGGNGSVVVRTNAGTDVVGVERVALHGGQRTVLARVADADTEAVDVVSGSVVAVKGGRLRDEVTVLAPEHAATFAYLRSLAPAATPWVVSRAGHQWVVQFAEPGRPSKYAIVDVHRQRSEPLFDEIPWPESKMGGGAHGFATAAFEVQAEGASLPSYLTFPVPAADSAPPERAEDWPKGSWPLVLLVHGGPWARDRLEFDPTVHWLASRGYMVLRVNFRGSRGFGKSFLKRGDGEWGDGMMTDLIAGVKQVQQAGRVSKGGVAVMGESFGGYAALALLTLPDLAEPLRCGVDEFGPTDLKQLERTLPAAFSASASWLADRLGADEDLEKASPLRYAGDLRAPLLVAQGDNDPRVPKEEAEQFVKAAPPGRVSYLHFAHEGHGFLATDDRMTFYRKVEAFLTKCFTPDPDADS